MELTTDLLIISGALVIWNLVIQYQMKMLKQMLELHGIQIPKKMERDDWEIKTLKYQVDHMIMEKGIREKIENEKKGKT